jgi:hypothetical protein
VTVVGLPTPLGAFKTTASASAFSRSVSARKSFDSLASSRWRVRHGRNDSGAVVYGFALWASTRNVMLDAAKCIAKLTRWSSMTLGVAP